MTSTDDRNSKHGGPANPIVITIDGREFRIENPNQTAAALLELAGLSASGYDLGELHGGNPKPKLYSDDAKVRVQDGDRFVSIRESASVA